MQFLRSTPLIARLVLAWLVLFVGVSVARPIVKPSATQAICSAGGVVKLVDLDGGDTDSGNLAMAPTLDCPLCGPMAHAVPVDDLPATQEASASQLFAGTDGTTRQAWTAHSPLPARGPPDSF